MLASFFSVRTLLSWRRVVNASESLRVGSGVAICASKSKFGGDERSLCGMVDIVREVMGVV